MTILTTTCSDPAAGALLDRYAPGSFLFATGEHSMLCEGGTAVASDGRPARLCDDVRAALRAAPAGDGSPPRVVGAIPFDTRRPARIVLPETVNTAANTAARDGGPAVGTNAVAPAGGLEGFRIDARPEPAEHVRAVEQGLAELRADPELRKLVLARSLEMRRDEPLDPRAIVTELAARHPDAYTFAAELPAVDEGQRRTMVGASPELLVSRRGTEVRSRPLAGSAERSADPAEDRRRAEALLASAKDRVEHAVVVEAIAGALRPLCSSLDVPAQPVLTGTPTMWHLATPIAGTLASLSTSALGLAFALHPTPAICGWPADSARSAIGRIESFDRGFYTGLVGWCDAEGDGEWAIAIRCAEMTAERVRLFAGGGIVAASDPEAELDETSAKLRTMLDAIRAAA